MLLSHLSSSDRLATKVHQASAVSASPVDMKGLITYSLRLGAE